MISERELRKMLRRREPPPDFLERVLARIDQRTRGGDTAIDRRPRLRAWQGFVAGGIAASVLVTVTLSRITAVRREVAAEKAARDVALALRITGEKLHEVQLKIAAHSGRGDQP